MTVDFNLLEARNELSRIVAMTGGRAVGIGVGLKEVCNSRLPVASVQVFVRRKLPARELSRPQRLPADIDGVPVDVIEDATTASVGRGTQLRAVAQPPAFGPGRGKHRPLVGGVSCSNLYSSGGTLGYFCEGVDASGRSTAFILGCGHVLQGRGGYKTSDSVIQASPADGGTSADVVATFMRAVPLVSGPRASNRVEAGVAEILGPTPFVPEVLGVGRIIGKAEPELGMRVIKVGRTTGRTTGVVTAVDFESTVSWSDDNPRTSYHFAYLIRIESDISSRPFALPGDSGALIVTEGEPKAVGLYFAGPVDGSYGLGSPIAAVEHALDVALLVEKP